MTHSIAVRYYIQEPTFEAIRENGGNTPHAAAWTVVSFTAEMGDGTRPANYSAVRAAMPRAVSRAKRAALQGLKH